MAERSDRRGGRRRAGRAVRLVAMPVQRLRGDDRREQILDAVSRRIVADGLDAITMESAAEAAAVSKALIYQHFANRDDLLVAVLKREIERLEQSTQFAVAAARSFEAEVAAAVPNFFARAARGSGLLETLIHTTHLGQPLRKLRREFLAAAEDHWAARAAEAYGLEPRTALIAAAIVLGGLGGLADFMERRGISQPEVERVFAGVVTGAGERLGAPGRRSRRRKP